ncbi:MAG TPA: NrfD/PsrC family molybdoenzyme membrane anchor subunit [Gemmataceae bacterium]|nr:NrfD/PsrC family molybdoenzyme membrane anchor subunit [Gemmataceae bacterium]
MATDTALRSVGYAQQEPIKAPPWHALVVWDLLFNGLTTGLFLAAAFAELVWPNLFTPLAKVAYPVALVFLIADLVLLVLDLGDWSRFHHMLRMFKPASPMSVGVWSLIVYALPLTVATVLSLLPRGAALEWVRAVALVLGLVPGLASAAYKGVLLSTSAQPGWRDARWLGGYLTSGAIVLGCAELVVLAYLMGQVQAVRILRPALGALLVVHSIPLIQLYGALRPAIDRVLTLLVIVSGLLLPLWLVIVGTEPAWMVAAAVLIILGSLASRFALLQIPHRSGFMNRSAAK